VLRQRARGWGSRLSRSLRLSAEGRRWRLCDNSSARCRLGDGLRRWSRLHTLPSGHSNTTSYDSSGGDAEPSPSNKVASGDNRPNLLLSWLFSWLGTDRLDRLVAC
jgi:hypothetical protein